MTLYVPVLEGGLRGKGGVAAIDLSTGRETPIFMTDHDPGTSNVPNLALSPDGRTLAMLEFVNHLLGISLVNMDGSSYLRLHAAGPSEISDAGTLAWSKDGRSILFGGTVDGNWGLMRIAVTGGKPEFAGLAGKGAQLVHRISLSPNGSRIAVGDGERETVEVWALDNLLPVLKAAK
jgi:WD40 repeat protein